MILDGNAAKVFIILLISRSYELLKHSSLTYSLIKPNESQRP